eukprot:14069205-Alexandrium_andersonii.AAC.1
MVSLGEYPLGSGQDLRFPFSGYEIVPPVARKGETWVGEPDRTSGSRLSRVRKVGHKNFLTLNAMCTASGCSKHAARCAHTLYYHVHLDEASGGDKRKQKWVQYARLVLFATEGLPAAPEAMCDHVVHHESYLWQRVGLPKKRKVADDAGHLEWQSRADHGHHHHGHTQRATKKRPASVVH